jgi:hypothetical protein
MVGVDFPIPVTIQISRPTQPSISDGPSFQCRWGSPRHCTDAYGASPDQSVSNLVMYKLHTDPNASFNTTITSVLRNALTKALDESEQARWVLNSRLRN